MSNFYQIDSLNDNSEGLDSLAKDTFYGIKEDQFLPHRNENKLTTEQPIKKKVLFNGTTSKTIIYSWQSLLLLLAILFLGLTKAFANNRFKQSLRALLNYGVAQEINREEKVFFHRGNILSTIVYFITFSLFIYHIKQVVNTTVLDEDNFLFFILIFSSVIFIYIIKFLFSKILFFVFNEFNIANEYIFNISLYNNLLGVLLIPVLCVAYFTSYTFNDVLYYLFFPILSIVFLMRLVRLFVIGNSKGISYFYIFLYICSLEILPLVVLYRIFIHK